MKNITESKYNFTLKTQKDKSLSNNSYKMKINTKRLSWKPKLIH